MFSKNPTYRLIFLAVTTGLFVLVSVFNFFDYADTGKGMKLTGGILFGVMAIFYAVDLYDFVSKKSNKGA